MSDTSSIAASNASLGDQISIAVVKKSQDAAKQQGQAVLSLLESAAQVQQITNNADPSLGRLVDVTG